MYYSSEHVNNACPLPHYINPLPYQGYRSHCFERQLCHLINVVINTVISLNTLQPGATTKLS